MIQLSADFSISYAMFFLVCFLVGLGSFIDASAGGGGLITMPAYLLTGMPAHFAYGCNKVSAMTGTTLAATTFLSHGAVHLFSALWAMAGSLSGAYLFARLALLLSDTTLRTLQLIVIPLAAIVIFFKKNLSEENQSYIFSRRKIAVLSLAIGFFIGGYDAIIGPGTGTFAIIAFAFVTKFDLTTASGNAKILNWASGFASFVAFFAAGTIYWKLALPAAVCSIIGNMFGAKLALSKGARYIRPMLIIVLSLLLVKLAIDLVFKH